MDSECCLHVGSTDPVRSLRDGAMLHIIRHYRPENILSYQKR